MTSEKLNLIEIKRKDLPLKSLLTIFETKIDEPQMDKDIIKEINKQGDKQNRQTNVKCQMTQWDMHEKPGFKLLSEYIKDMSKKISKEQFNVTIKPYIKNMWGMKYKSEELAVAHDHWPATWSCAYYVNAPKDAPGLFFPEIGDHGGERQLEQGLLIMFPGHTKHAVRSKKFKGYRYAVSANIHDYNSYK